MNYRRVLHLLFGFATARGYAADNPIAGVQTEKVRGHDVAIFTPSEITRLPAAASPDFLPCLAIGAFAGLRSAEIERLEWTDIDLAGRHIVIGASRAKTATRRIVPISDNWPHGLHPTQDRPAKFGVAPPMRFMPHSRIRPPRQRARPNQRTTSFN